MVILFSRALLAAAAIALLGGASDPGQITHGKIPAGLGKAPINWEARSFAVDYATGHIHLRGDAKISQGDTSIAADEAEATSTTADSKNSHWVFTGKVHVRVESQGDLHSDHATLEITNGELASALVTGSPAQFEQTRSTTGRLVKGHATTINYEVGTATVKLTGDAWLTDDRNENDMKACEITYNVRNRQVQGESERCPDNRVHVTIIPRAGSAPAAGSAPPAGRDTGQGKP
jgi:lipopolysaccharide transport protein LptA